MRKFRAYFLMSLKTTFEYRGDFFIFFISNTVTPVVSLAIWLTISQTNSSLPFNKTELIWYFIIIAFINNLTVDWHAPYINEEINNGLFSRFLIKPISFITEIFSSNLSEKVPKLPIIFGLLVVLKFSTNFQEIIQNQITFITLVLFLLSLFFAILINVLTEINIGLLAFWVHDITFIRNYTNLISDFLSGEVIPLMFLPTVLLSAAVWLPFRYMASYPVEIILGKLSVGSMWFGFVCELSWVIILYTLYRFILTKGMRSYQGYGM